MAVKLARFVLCLAVLLPLNARAVESDWAMYAHDNRRTGYTNDGVISRANARQLTRRWIYSVGSEISASPVVWHGTVYVGSCDGDVVALDARTGNEKWRRMIGNPEIGNCIRATPEIYRGILFVQTRPPTNRAGSYDHFGATLFALNPFSGGELWRFTVSGVLRSEPAFVGDVIFIGRAGGDPPLTPLAAWPYSFGCNQGGLSALNIMSGRLLWNWFLDPKPDDGGSVWSPISTDGVRIYAGTGNTCSASAVNYENGLVAFDTIGNLLWGVSLWSDPLKDNDTGGGTLILGNELYVLNKSGVFYSYLNSGALRWKRKLFKVDSGAGEAQSATGTPTSDGRTVLISGGLATGDSGIKPLGGRLLAYDRAGGLKWVIHPQREIYGYAAISRDTAVFALDQSIAIADVKSGSLLAELPTEGLFYASPAVTSQGVYAADLRGNVYGFRLTKVLH